MFDDIDMKDQVARASDQVAFLQKAFSAGLEITPKESRGVSDFMGHIQDSLPKAEQRKPQSVSAVR